MPASPATDGCTFDGTAATVTLRGEGDAVLLDPAPFTGDRAAKVELATVRIGNFAGRLEREHPEHLEPIRMNKPGQKYDITYEAGIRLIVRIAEGGQNGSFQGTLPDASWCASRFCDLVWEPGPKQITLERTDQRPVLLT